MGLPHIARASGEGADGDRILRSGLLGGALRRPETGAVAGAIALWTYFAFAAGDSGFLTLGGTASYLEVSAQLGILAAAVCLLMIGGEFDLSIGSVIGASGMVLALLTVEYGWNIWPAIAVAVLASLGIGVINGILVLRTGLPSFIITLATLFVVRGLTIAITRQITGRTQLGGMRNVPGSMAPNGSSRSVLRSAPPSSRLRSRGGWR